MAMRPYISGWFLAASHELGTQTVRERTPNPFPRVREWGCLEQLRLRPRTRVHPDSGFRIRNQKCGSDPVAG